MFYTRQFGQGTNEIGRFAPGCVVNHDFGATGKSALNILDYSSITYSFQVRERNLNPKAACLKRREEEKLCGMSSDNKMDGGMSSSPMLHHGVHHAMAGVASPNSAHMADQMRMLPNLSVSTCAV